MSRNARAILVHRRTTMQRSLNVIARRNRQLFGTCAEQGSPHRPRGFATRGTRLVPKGGPSPGNVPPHPSAKGFNLRGQLQFWSLLHGNGLPALLAPAVFYARMRRSDAWQRPLRPCRPENADGRAEPARFPAVGATNAIVWSRLSRISWLRWFG
jgi:hypothetical protein